MKKKPRNKKKSLSKALAKATKSHVQDATAPLEIEITAADVKRSRKKDPASCAAAVALMRQLHATHVKVFLTKTYVKQGDVWLRYQTPESMSREITSFDRSSIFEPGCYTLPPVSPSMRLGRKQGGSQTHPNTGKKRTIHHVTVNVRERSRLPKD